ncbi:MAG TPA: hypothetical protein VK358_07445 [Longimicrobium sp.]|nr:hypothetical protein [Longimicrobium sp.]
MRHTKLVPTTVLALLFTAACDSSQAPVGPEPGDASANRAAPQASVRTSDDEFARVARAEVPGFAGYYLRDDGTPVVRLTDPSQRGAAQRYLAQELLRARGGRHKGAPQQPVFLQSAYDFAQLKDWSEALHPLLTSRDDVYLIDVDEVENRVLVGVADATATGAVRAEAARAGIPAAALHVRTQERPAQRATVQDWAPTLIGGIQIAFGQYYCTLGFNATRAATNQSIFVTNSHCTNYQYAYDGVTIYQNVAAGGYEVGTEVHDQSLYACVSGVASCRRSDAAYIGHNGVRAIGQGGIARTAWGYYASGGLTITGEYDIVARYSGSVPVGTWLDKTGRTTGSTYGQVTNSCVTIGSLRCQDVSRVYSAGGDSGSPMFVYLGGAGAAENDVQLYGILWGGPGTDYTTTYSSRLSGIEADLGGLYSLCRPGYGC